MKYIEAARGQIESFVRGLRGSSRPIPLEPQSTSQARITRRRLIAGGTTLGISFLAEGCLSANASTPVALPDVQKSAPVAPVAPAEDYDEAEKNAMNAVTAIRTQNPDLGFAQLSPEHQAKVKSGEIKYGLSTGQAGEFRACGTQNPTVSASPDPMHSDLERVGFQFKDACIVDRKTGQRFNTFVVVEQRASNGHWYDSMTEQDYKENR